MPSPPFGWIKNKKLPWRQFKNKQYLSVSIYIRAKIASQGGLGSEFSAITIQRQSSSV